MAGAQSPPQAGPSVHLLDTTLRDGATTPGFAPTASERIAIARAIVEAGVDAIEVASAGDADDGLIGALPALPGSPAVCVIGRATSDDVGLAVALLERAERRRIHLYADVRRREALAPALEAIWAARVNVDEVEFSPLAGCTLSHPWLVEVALAAFDSGATVFGVSDTAGDAQPADVHACVAAIVERLDAATTRVSFHGHDDAGRACENAVAACRAGARQVHVCVSGLGPRGGNTNAQSLLPALAAAGIATNAALPPFERAGELVAACRTRSR